MVIITQKVGVGGWAGALKVVNVGLGSYYNRNLWALAAMADRQAAVAASLAPTSYRNPWPGAQGKNQRRVSLKTLSHHHPMGR